MKIYCRKSWHDQPFKMSQDLIYQKIHALENYAGHEGAATYLFDVIEKSIGEAVINMDEDLFIFDKDVFDEVQNHFLIGKFNYCGVLDSQALSHRNNVSPVVMNPFFNIFNFESDPFEGLSRLNVLKTQYNPEWKYLERYPCQRANEGEQTEPYNGIFNLLFEKGFKALYLDARPDIDDFTTVISFNGKDFAYHSWYSREYNSSEYHKARIDNVYNAALTR